MENILTIEPQNPGVVSSMPWLGRVLVACEYSGAVRDAFAKLGWDAWSCDLLPSETPGNHYQGDVRDILGAGWDILIAHPPCTHLAVSGARWFPAKRASGEQQAALDFVRLLLAAPVPHIALENPVSIISSKIRKPDQVIQPWMFGHGETKATCLWLKNLPKLTPTRIVEGREARVHKMPPGPDRWKERSRTLPGIAQAFADQWTRATRPNTEMTRANANKGQSHER
jgi:site-specific DNA-cytosine methylase